MTLADFLSSGNLKDLLHDQNILKESRPEWIINSLLPLALIPNANDQDVILKYLKTDLESLRKAGIIWKVANGYRLSSNKGIDNIELLYPGIVIRSNLALSYMAAGGIVGYYFELLKLNGLQKLADTFIAFFCLFDFLAEYFHQPSRENIFPLVSSELKQNTTSYMVEHTYVSFDPDSDEAFKVTFVTRGVTVLFSFGVTLLILNLIRNAMIKNQQIKEQKLPLSRASGPNQEDSMSGLAKLANEVLSLASENAKLESKKQAQTQKINKKIFELRGNDDDDELISMVDEYLSDLPGAQEKINLFETIKKQHRSTIKQDENHHNKTHLNLISHFFEGLEVNDLF